MYCYDGLPVIGPSYNLEKKKEKNQKKRKEFPLPGFEPGFLITRELPMCYNRTNDMSYIYILICLLNKTNFYS